MTCEPIRCRYISEACHLVVSLAPDGTIRQTDGLRPKALGYEPERLLGKPLSQIVNPKERSHLARILERCETGQPVWDDLEFVRADGAGEPMLCCFQPLGGAEDGGLLLVTGLKHGRVEREARAETAAVLGLLAFRCHRPIHRLMQIVEALRAERPSSPVADQCRAELDALIEVMNSAAAWPAADAGSAQPTNVVGVLEGALRLLDADPPASAISVDLRPDEAAMWAQAHPVGLACVAMHLVSNARDATTKAKKPHLAINVYRRESRVVLEFTDNGCGLAREDRQAAFSPFFAGPKSAPVNPGVGLTTCCELVHFMSGTIRMQSRRGRGTTVFLTFPAAAPPN